MATCPIPYQNQTANSLLFLFSVIVDQDHPEGRATKPRAMRGGGGGGGVPEQRRI